MCLLQNLRYLASWEMPALGKTAGCGGKSPAQELSPCLTSHQPPSGKTMTNTNHRPATWGTWDTVHTPLKGCHGVQAYSVREWGAAGPSKWPQDSLTSRVLNAGTGQKSKSLFCAKLCGQGCLDEVSFLPRRLTRGLQFSSIPSPLPRPALCGSELWLGKPWVSQLPLLFGQSSDLKCLHR